MTGRLVTGLRAEVEEVQGGVRVSVTLPCGADQARVFLDAVAAAFEATMRAAWDAALRGGPTFGPDIRAGAERPAPDAPADRKPHDGGAR